MNILPLLLVTFALSKSFSSQICVLMSRLTLVSEMSSSIWSRSQLYFLIIIIFKMLKLSCLFIFSLTIVISLRVECSLGRNVATKKEIVEKLLTTIKVNPLDSTIYDFQSNKHQYGQLFRKTGRVGSVANINKDNEPIRTRISGNRSYEQLFNKATTSNIAHSLPVTTALNFVSLEVLPFWFKCNEFHFQQFNMEQKDNNQGLRQIREQLLFQQSRLLKETLEHCRKLYLKDIQIRRLKRDQMYLTSRYDCNQTFSNTGQELSQVLKEEKKVKREVSSKVKANTKVK